MDLETYEQFEQEAEQFSAISPYLVDGTLRHILPHIRGEEAQFHLIYLKRENLPRKTRLLIDFLMECAQRETALFAVAVAICPD